MATTRTFDSLGIWALNANTVIPPTPVTGDAYRNTATNQSTNEEGEPFDTFPDSAVFNQKLFIVSSFTDEINKRGIVGWSDAVNYTVPAIVFASDGSFYFCLADSGPSTIVKDPAGEAFPGFWEIYVSGQVPIDQLAQYKIQLAEEGGGDEGTRLVGHTGQTAFAAIDARTTIASLAATSGATLVNTATNDILQKFLPRVLVSIAGGSNGPKGDVVGTSIGVATTAFNIGTQDVTINFTTPFANNLYHAFVSANDVSGPQYISAHDPMLATPSTAIIGSSDVTGAGAPALPPYGFTLMIIPNG